MTRLHHIALGAHDVERVAAFYRDVLGLPECRRHHRDDGSLRSVWLELGQAMLMVEATDAQGSPVESVGKGPFLIALSVEIGERATVEKRIEEQGRSPIELRTAYTSYARDPEGNRVAISHYPQKG
jgi:catechol 2,3-dioxygenase-like lactoylglutathione lyase family enzyme